MKREESDHKNPKYQFLYDELAEKIKRKALAEKRYRCHKQNHLRIIVKWIAKSDTTIAARILTKRGDIFPVTVEDELLAYPCEGGEPITVFDREDLIENAQSLVFDAPTLYKFETE